MRGKTRFFATTGLLVAALIAGVIAWFRAGNAEEVTQTVASAKERPGARFVPGPALGVDRSERGAVVLMGTIRSAATGDGIAGATLCAFCAECRLGPDQARPVCVGTNERGEYRLTDLEPGDYRLSAGARGYEPAKAARGRVLRIGKAGLRESGLDALLKTGGVEISGRVTDVTGGPVVGATVEAHFYPDEVVQRLPIPQITTSDDTGGFSLTVPKGEVRVVGRADGYAPANLHTVSPARGLRLVVTPAASLSGYVVTAAEGTPVANVTVNAMTLGCEQWAVSDNRGAFTISGLRPGTYTLSASGPGWLGRYSGTVTVDIIEALEEILVPVVPGAKVEGTMSVGEDPCTRGTVTLVPAPGESLPNLQARTDIEGKILFEAVPSGRYQSFAKCEEYGEGRGPDVSVVEGGASGLRWALSAGASASVHAVTPEGTSVERAWVWLKPASEANPSAPQSTREGWTDASGVIEFKGLREGRYLVGSLEQEEPIEVDIRSATEPNRFTLVIDPRGFIEVQVEYPDGNANDEVAVSALPVGGGPSGRMGQRRGGGRYRIGPLAVGAYFVEVRDGVNPRVRAGGPNAEVDVRSGEVTVVEATVGGHRGSITGRVVDHAGAPVEGVWVGAEPSNHATDTYGRSLAWSTQAEQRRSYSDAEGRFKVEGLDEDGIFTLVATRRLGGEQRVENVHAGQDTEIVLGELAKLSGIVLDQNGQPASNFQLSVNNRETHQNLIPRFGPDSKGRWTLEDVTPGTVEILAAIAGGAQARVTLDVSPGQTMEGITLKLEPVSIARK